jgi:hypothetical protein
MPATSGCATASMRDSTSIGFGSIGRSNSSPATPHATVNLDRPAMTPMASLPVNSSIDAASGLMPSTAMEDALALGVDTQEMQTALSQSQGRSSMEVPIPTATVQSKSTTRSGSGVQSHAAPPTLRRANSSSSSASNSVRASSTGPTEGGKSIRHRNSIGSGSEYSLQDNGEVAVKTSSSSAQRTASSSSSTTTNLTSPRIVFTPSMPAHSPVNETSQFSQMSGLGLGQSSGAASSSLVTSPTVLSTATVSAVSNPVPAVVQTHKARASSKKSSSSTTSSTSSSASSTTNTTSSGRPGSSRSRSKAARTFQMTSLDH